MKKFIPIAIISLFFFLASGQLKAQENRTIDGTKNNLINYGWGAVGAEVLTETIGFADSISSPAGPERPNARFISNNLFAQNTLANDNRRLSAYTWAFGQFIDHDITLSPESHTEKMVIDIPPFDPYFDPKGTGEVKMNINASAYVPGSGTDPNNPRKYTNEITAFIDASAVYGSDMERANWLRAFEGGKLKMSAGNLLPYNTVTGEFVAQVDPNAPMMAMPLPFAERWFVAGDLRANENPFLLAMHTVFAREHNRLCDELALEYPAWKDEALYQHARKLVGAMLQAIVYEEWLPALGMEIPPYNGFKLSVNPGIMNVFNTAAYRYGHTTINSLLVRMDNKGNYMPQGDILLRDAYFNPKAITDVNGIEPYLIGMATVVEQDFDCKVIDDLRNFLFGAPGAGGMDLVAINISRGRERGLPDYNTVRKDFGLEPIQSFAEISDDPLANQSLEFVYGDINQIDPWVGMLAEKHMPDALFGETAMTIIKKQFMALRDGDRFYYRTDPWISLEEKDWIVNTRLADLIRRNTNITIVQDDLFVAESVLTSLFESRSEETVSFGLYPNPVRQRMSLRIEAGHSQEAQLQIINSQGQVVLERTLGLSPGNNIVSLTLPHDLPAGNYAATIQAEGRVGTQQFVKL